MLSVRANPDDWAFYINKLACYQISITLYVQFSVRKCQSTSSPPSLLRGSLREINFKLTQLISLAYFSFLLNAGNGYSDFVEHCAFVEHSDANERLLLFPVQPLDRLEP